MSVKGMTNKKYEFMAPDGGWGYMICFGAIINMVCITAFVNCFGVIYKTLFIQLNMDSTTITFSSGLNVFCGSIAAFMTNSLLKYTSIRKLGVAAAFVFNLGIFSTVFANSKAYFFISQGLLQGIGQGIIFNLSCTVLNNYFVKRRLLAVSFTHTVVAACAFVTPQLVKWLHEVYGFRGTLLLISAVSMHSIFAMTLMQPVSWHMKKVEVPVHKDDEIKSLLVNDKKYVTDKEDLTASIKSYKLEHSRKDSEENCKTEGEKDHSSLLKKFVSQFVHVSLFKSYVLSNACIGSSLCVFSDVTFTIMLPQALYFMGWNEREVAWALSLNALGDLVTRIMVIFMSSLLTKVGSHEVYVVGLFVAFGSRLGMLWSDNRTTMVTFLTVMGASRCTIMVLTPIVIGDAVDQDKFTSAMGLHVLLVGFYNLAVGPVVGIVRDLTDSYATAFYILTSFFAIVMMFWSIELFYKKSKHKRQPKMDISSPSGQEILR